MDSLTLLERAARAGLSVHLAGDRVTVRGPVSQSSFVQELLSQKAAIIAALRYRNAEVHWSDAAREVYQERLGIADELGIDTSPGSPAESTARREARRVAAGFPDSASTSRTGDLIDAALEAFEPLGGLRLVSVHPRGSADDQFQKHRDCPPPGLPIGPHDGLDRDGGGSDSPTPMQEAP